MNWESCIFRSRTKGGGGWGREQSVTICEGSKAQSACAPQFFNFMFQICNCNKNILKGCVIGATIVLNLELLTLNFKTKELISSSVFMLIKFLLHIRLIHFTYVQCTCTTYVCTWVDINPWWIIIPYRWEECVCLQLNKFLSCEISYGGCVVVVI